MLPVFRVSHLAAYARWKDEDGDDVGWLYNSIFVNTQTEAMRKGTAFHSALEIASAGEYESIVSGGYTFTFKCDAQLVLPKTRELRLSKDYGGIIVSGQCDGIEGRVIHDHKTTDHFDAERYFSGWQHKYYMDIFNADHFRWHVWVMREQGERSYDVTEYHLLTQSRYPEISHDCRELAQDFREFVANVGWKGVIK